LLERELQQGSAYPRFSVVADAVDGRTTQYDRVNRPGKNLSRDLGRILEEANPDIVVLAVGENDLNTEIRSSAEQVANSVGERAMEILDYADKRPGKGPLEQLIIVASPFINQHASLYDELELGSYFDARSVEESSRVPRAVRQVVEEMKDAGIATSTILKFANANMLGYRPGQDGLHMEAESHYFFARSIAHLILDLPGAELVYGIDVYDEAVQNEGECTIPARLLANLQIDKLGVPWDVDYPIKHEPLPLTRPLVKGLGPTHPDVLGAQVLSAYASIIVGLRKRKMEQQIPELSDEGRQSYEGLADFLNRPSGGRTFQRNGPLIYGDLELFAGHRWAVTALLQEFVGKRILSKSL
jgi:lysophospholipase L1-like esterase